jgi:hypothetical protein
MSTSTGVTITALTASPAANPSVCSGATAVLYPNATVTVNGVNFNCNNLIEVILYDANGENYQTITITDPDCVSTSFKFTMLESISGLQGLGRIVYYDPGLDITSNYFQYYYANTSTYTCPSGGSPS